MQRGLGTVKKQWLNATNSQEIRANLGFGVFLQGQLSESEIAVLAKKVIDELCPTSMRDMGKVMFALTPQVRGKADNLLMSGLIRKKLA